MTSKQFDNFIRRLLKQSEALPPFIFCVYLDGGKVKYNEFDMQLNLLGGGDIKFMIERLQRLSK